MNSYPLSRSQERLWFEEWAEPGMATYNRPSCFHLVGLLNLEVLQKSIQAVVDRHDALRTIFRDSGDQVVQVVQEYDPEIFSVIDREALPAGERLEAARRAAVQEARTPFDLTRGPLVRVRVQRLTASEHLLSFTFHHTISDGWSTNVFFKELSEIYRAYSMGHAPSLPAVPVQFGEYARKERESAHDASAAQSLAYWKQHLGETVPPLDLPADRTRPAVRRSVGTTYHFNLGPDLTGRLKALSARSEATLFMLLLAAFKALLYRYTEQENVAVGIPVAGRRSPALFDAIGFYVNTIVLRTSLEGDLSFLELLKRVRHAVWSALEHQDFRFEELVQVLQVRRDQSRTPLFQVMFVQNPVTEPFHLDGISVHSINVENGSSLCDLALFVKVTGEDVQARFEYCTDLFDEATIGRMAGHYTRLLEGIAEMPECPIRRLPILGEEERKGLLRGATTSGADRSTRTSVHQRFEEQVERNGEAVALISGNERLSYRELNRRANRVAYRLRAKGIAEGNLVGLCAERSMDLIVGILAAMKAGGAYMPLDPRYPHERLRFIVNDAQPKVILAQRQTVPAVGDLGIPVACIDEDNDDLPREANENPEWNFSGENLAYAIYTSGSTGQPKGVLVAHRSLARFFDCIDELFDFGPADTWALFHSFTFDVSMLEIWGTLLYGGKLVIVPYDVIRDPHQLYDLLLARKVTVLSQTPSAFLPLAQYEESLGAHSAGSLRYVIFGGELLDVRMLAPWVRRHGLHSPRLINMYGPTEATVYVSHKALSQEDLDRTGIIGAPLADAQILVLDRELQLVPIGVPGEICIAGDCLAKGYLHRPEIEAKKFVPNPYSGDPNARLYRSGDRGRILANGEVEFLGRFDDQVKVRGFRVEPAEIESHLLTIPGVIAAKVIAQQDQTGDRYLVAYYVTRSGGPISGTDIRQKLAGSLPDYMVPSRFVLIDRMPLTPSGKLDRSALPGSGQDTEEREHLHVQPRDAVEKRIATVWSEILQTERIGAFDSFFELGGHSLTAMRAVLRLSREFGIPLSIRTLFDHPSVAELAQAIAEVMRPGSPERQ